MLPFRAFSTFRVNRLFNEADLPLHLYWITGLLEYINERPILKEFLFIVLEP